MLTDEEREVTRKLAEGISSVIDDAHKYAYGQAAHRFIDQLRELCGSDDVAARVAVAFSEFASTLERLPLMYVVDSLDASGAAYAFAAGHLAGVYTLPERQAEPEGAIGVPATPEQENESDIDLSGIGGYL